MKVPECEILNHEGYYVAVMRFGERMEVLSSAIFNGGDNVTDTVFIMQVPKNFMHDDPPSYAEEACIALGLPEDSVGLMTAAEVKHVFSHGTEEFGGIEVFAAVTAGLSNQVIAGDVLEDWERRSELSRRRSNALAGTINTVGVSPVPLTQAAKVNIMIAMTEAKTAAMASFGYKETGTTSDSIVVVSPVGEPREPYSGTGTPLGIAMARAVKSGVMDSLRKRGDNVHGNYLDILAEAGISKEMLIRAISGHESPDKDISEGLNKILDELTDEDDIAVLTQFAVSSDLILERLKGEIVLDGQSLMDVASKDIASILKTRIYEYVSEQTDIYAHSSMYNKSLLLTERAGDILKGIVEGLAEGISVSRNIKSSDKRYQDDRGKE